MLADTRYDDTGSMPLFAPLTGISRYFEKLPTPVAAAVHD